MATLSEGPFPLKLYGEEDTSSASDDPVVAILFFAICLLLGIVSKYLLRGSKVPYTVALLVIGVALGSLEYGTGRRLGTFGAGIRLWAKINPDLLLAVFLPALLFESSFSMKSHHIKSCIVQMFLLAGPGVLISTFLLGSALKFAFPYDWSWKTSLLLGVILSATDPVAVVALLKELGARKNLTTVIEGESLMNDGLAVVLYQLFSQMILGRSFGFVDMVKYLLQVCSAAVGIGLAFGVASLIFLGYIYNDTIIEITLTLAVSYIAYFIAQDGGVASGILTVMTLGMLYSAVSRTAFKGDGQHSLHHFWEMVAYIANTLIFILSGVVIAEEVLSSKTYWKTHETSWGYLLLLYVFVQVIRMVVVGVLYPCLRYSGSGMSLKEATIVSWAGLRGPVSLSLALSVKRTSDTTSFLSQDTATLFVFFTLGIVFLTLIVNGSTTEFILHFLRMLSSDKLSSAKSRVLDYTKGEMMNKALKAFGDLGDDDELGPSDWSTVRNYLHCLDTLEMKQLLPTTESKSNKMLDSLDLKDIRIRLLNGVQTAYCKMLEEGRISQPTAKLMMDSVHESMDVVAHEVLCDWNALKDHVHIPSYYKFLQMRLCPQKLVTYYMVEGLESGCLISAAFLRAHRIARRHLHDFLGENETVHMVLTESEVEGEEARKFLDDIHAICPQVLRAVKTRQMTYSILKQLSDHVQNMDNVGLLEEREVNSLNDAVQTDLKKLLRIPPSTKNPTIPDLFRAHPFSGTLPAIVPEVNKELIQLRGATLYTEGFNPSGIWLVSSGLVESMTLRNKQSLDPMFSRGSTLGLYEVLIGKPYICSMIASSVVRCFFIEVDHLLSLRSDPTVEAFLWQESVITVSKLLLPQVYEKLSMQEMRSLIAERSMMNVYMEGETVEITVSSIGFLLEGLVRSQEDLEQVVSSPAVLLPSQDTNCDRGSRYVVETKARVIVFDMEGHNRKQIELMRWPEHFDVPGLPDGHGNSLAAKALQICVFGNDGAENDIVIRVDSSN